MSSADSALARETPPELVVCKEKMLEQEASELGFVEPKQMRSSLQAVGYAKSAIECGFLLDTSKAGNSNRGHEFDDRQWSGRAAAVPPANVSTSSNI